MSVIISNGFSRFHLAIAAAEASRRETLNFLLTGAYPTPIVRKVTDVIGLARQRKLARLLDRAADIPEYLVCPFWSAESLHLSAQFLPRSFPFRALRSLLDTGSLSWYGRLAARRIRRSKGASIYHYRAGFGGTSVLHAKVKGMVALCDHSIAHPEVLEFLVENTGRLPSTGDVKKVSRIWRLILRDIEQADAVLVNSDFVKETFLHLGWDTEKIHVIYLGVDDRFLEAIPERPAPPKPDEAGPIRLLFAGALERRKGARELLGALALIGDDFPWTLEIAGSIHPAIARDFQNPLSGPRVRHLGILSRAELAERMAHAEIFVFCSLAEGSARVVFEALAAGCYVVTTPNSGSIVQDGIHGALVPPGVAEPIARTLREAFGNRDRIREIGSRNAELIRCRYRQKHYGDALEKLYRELLATQSAG